MIYCQPVSGMFTTNAYFYIDDSTNSGFIIDPGAESDLLLNIIYSNDLNIEQILLTHGHFDHFGAAQKIQDELKIPICIHEEGKEYVENPIHNLSANSRSSIILKNVTYLKNHYRIISKYNNKFYLELIHIPGHTTDSSMYYNKNDNVAFVGDMIFKNAMAITNFWGGDFEIWIENVSKKILTLPKHTVLLSGHTDQTTVGDELTRPWYQQYI